VRDFLGDAVSEGRTHTNPVFLEVPIMFRKLQGVGALAFLFSLVAVPACGGSPGATADSTAQGDTTAENFFSCHTDDDCVAVARVGCCSNGWKEAVNVDEVDDYEASGPKVCNMMCPRYMVLDTRVAECNRAQHKCEMVAIQDIQCGGFVANPHHCPDGYDCVSNGIPDAPGSCQKQGDADAGPAPDATPGDDADTNDGGAPDAGFVTCATLECDPGYHCCGGLFTANGPMGDATCQPDGTFCPLY
jgi:hypothetical protein